jgi:hypothetical protein
MLALHENALLAALGNHRDIKGRVRTIASLPRLFGDKLLQRYVVDAPALYVVPGRITMKDDEATLEFTVAGVVRNVAGQDQARKGDGIDLGCDHLLVLAIRALNAQRLGNCSWSATTAEMADDELFDKAGISAIEIKFSSSPVALDSDFGEAQLSELTGSGSDDDSGGALGSFNTLHADFDIAPQAGTDTHDKWLSTPPDFSSGQPDMTLDVDLTGANE